MSEGSQIKGLIFDCYHTLIDIQTDESSFSTYDAVSKWLQYRGVKVDPSVLKEEYRNRTKYIVETSAEFHPEIKIEEVFESICNDHSMWDIDAKELGIETSIVFRSASLRKIEAYPQSRMVLEKYRDLPKCIVSNGQRVFSEVELKFLGLHEYFDFIIFSSDVRYKKPDTRLFEKALGLLGLEAHEVLSIGDTPENDIFPPQELGMQAMHIRDAWKEVADIENKGDEAENTEEA
ncbi:HAD family hydrolase [Methanolobus psychrotolerans]|uniref:HAD family hydrolase n=1 Tax=Methanolobus psychrotolerans TaxID=1874706 RepID=UPI000B91C6BB|nr:HAD family hydrolase [Methanolobus psychrotolerans]